MIVERQGSMTRLEAFSDGMLAFAATLLVVSLETPPTHDQLVDGLLGFAPFALSFAALYFIWVAHTNLFRRYGMTDSLTVILNGVLLFTVLFYVFPLKFMANGLAALFTGHRFVSLESPRELQNLFVIYAIGWTLVFACFALLYLRAYAQRGPLQLTPVEAYDAVTLSRHYATFAITGILSLLLAVAGVGVAFGLPGLAYMALGLLARGNWRARERGRPSLTATDVDPPDLPEPLPVEAS